MPYLTALTLMKPPFFVLVGFVWSPSQFLRYLSQTLMWFCLVKTPVMIVTVNVTLFWEWLLNHVISYIFIFLFKVFVIFLCYMNLKAPKIYSQIGKICKSKKPLTCTTIINVWAVIHSKAPVLEATLLKRDSNTGVFL